MQKEKRVIWADTYDKDDIKYSFDFSQFSQDWVINRILDIDEGFFLDIGAGVSDLNAEEVLISCMSNTYGLERFRDWNGIAIDYDDVYIREASKFRSCTLVCEDLMKTNINEILKQHDAPQKMDYLSFDVDAAQEKVLEDLDLSTYSFRAITFEHNLHLSFQDDNWKKVHRDSRDKFISSGYKILFGNVGLHPNQPVEDWYVDQETFDKYEKISSENLTRDQIIGKILRA